ncbi:MAG TPA: putative glycolipid-binding domain-containing protein [Acidimicrobiales bacterium]|nr:putative glycolipid-binding domain-containing protein [Acidimicrobiales bacterium]
MATSPTSTRTPATSRARDVAWRGPDPVRTEAAHVVLGPDRMAARGTSAVAGHALDWVLTTGPGWVTRRLSVRARGDGWARRLDLVRSDAGTWSASRRDATDGDGEGHGEGHALDVTGLDAALDCDLALCPVTNTMPVLRHDLVAAARRGGGPAVDLVMAWVDVPDLTLHVSPQTYTALGPADGGGALVGFTSGTFAATLDLDADGLVRHYPGLATRLAG